MTTPFYIFAGGGTGGHLYPGIAVAQALRRLQPDADILFLCTQRDIDARILSANNCPFEAQPVLPIPHRPGQVIPFLNGWFASQSMARRHIRHCPPAAVLGLGGYAAVPAMKLARQNRIPVAMLNPDAVPGLANNYARRFADRIFVQWDESRPCFGRHAHKCLTTGCPIRSAFAQQHPRPRILQDLNLNPAKKVLTVMAGSQGGRNVNDAVVETLGKNPALREKFQHTWQIVHLTGPADCDTVRSRYQAARLDALVHAYTEKIPQLFAVTNLIVARAGASSLAEIAAMGLPAILIPYPYHKDQHQLKNARNLSRTGAAKIVTDHKNTPRTAADLTAVLQDCIQDNVLHHMTAAARNAGRPDAAHIIAQHLIKLNP